MVRSEAGIYKIFDEMSICVGKIYTIGEDVFFNKVNNRSISLSIMKEVMQIMEELNEKEKTENHLYLNTAVR